jgi:hypothetical protein
VTNTKKHVPAKLTVAAPAGMVQPIHFEDFSGNQFERLVFAYHARSDRWMSLEWFGQVGKDKGRDIVGVREVDGRKDGQPICVLCANWQKLTLAKVKKDLDSALKSLTRPPEKVRVVCGHSVATKLRDQAKAYAATKGVHDCELWSGTEFEEHIRSHAESLLYRFIQGEAFPDTANDLLLFAWGSVPINDDERLAMISLAFDRPAFSTPIHQESSLPAFKKALDDTIAVLQTGIWQTRAGVAIRRLPMIKDVEDSTRRDALKSVLKSLVSLRSSFDSLLRKGRITHCACGDEDCPVYTMADDAIQELTAARDKVLAAFSKAYPSFTMSDS